MLQFYDKTWAVSVLAFAALAAPVSLAHGAPEDSCDLSNGYALNADAFDAEAKACLAATTRLADVEDRIRALSDRQRAKAGMAPLKTRAALNDAARLHALDMAARGYTKHSDLEGRSHLQRVRMLDRTLLVGAFGANVAAIPGEDSIDAFNALIGDSANRRNLVRDEFSHLGVGAAASDGMLYVVQLFAQADGELRRALPFALTDRSALKAEFADAGFTPIGWRLENAEGRTLAQGRGDRLHRRMDIDEPAYLEVAVSRDLQTYYLKGPMVAPDD